MAENVNKELLNASKEFESLAAQVNEVFNQAPSFPIKY